MSRKKSGLNRQIRLQKLRESGYCGNTFGRHSEGIWFESWLRTSYPHQCILGFLSFLQVWYVKICHDHCHPQIFHYIYCIIFVKYTVQWHITAADVTLFWNNRITKNNFFLHLLHKLSLITFKLTMLREVKVMKLPENMKILTS